MLGLHKFNNCTKNKFLIWNEEVSLLFMEYDICWLCLCNNNESWFLAENVGLNKYGITIDDIIYNIFHGTQVCVARDIIVMSIKYKEIDVLLLRNIGMSARFIPLEPRKCYIYNKDPKLGYLWITKNEMIFRHEQDHKKIFDYINDVMAINDSYYEISNWRKYFISDHIVDNCDNLYLSDMELDLPSIIKMLHMCKFRLLDNISYAKQNTLEIKYIIDENFSQVYSCSPEEISLLGSMHNINISSYIYYGKYDTSITYYIYKYD